MFDTIQPAYLEEPADPFFKDVTVLGQFRRRRFFCLACQRRGAPSLHRDGVLIVAHGRWHPVGFSCLAKMQAGFRGQVLEETLARRILPFVQLRYGLTEDTDVHGEQS